MLGHPRRRLPALAAIALAVLARGPALAFDDQEFCVVAQQFAAAANKDVGVWIDRVTRNAGVDVSCASRMVEFKRFTYTPSASMTAAWKESKAQEWNTYQCSSRLWGEAIQNGWKIALSMTAADRRQLSLNAQCR
jgi:hypothetical protein